LKPHRRYGFIISPRLAFPVLLVIVLLMFLVFATMGGGVSDARIVGTVVVTVGLLLLFGILALLSRSGGPKPRNAEASTAAA